MALCWRILCQVQEMQVWSLGQEDALKQEVAPVPVFLPWKIPRTEKPGGLQSMRSQRVGHSRAHTYTCRHVLTIFHSLLVKCSIFVPRLQYSCSTEYALFRDVHWYKIAYLHSLFRITFLMNFQAEIIWGWSPHWNLVQISPTDKTRVK